MGKSWVIKKHAFLRRVFFSNNFKYNKKNENSELSTLFKACFFVKNEI